MKKKTAKRCPLAPHRWDGLPMLQPAYALNARCFGLLSQIAAGQSSATGSYAMDLLRASAAQLDARASERAGRCPVLLVNLNFQDAEWWRCLTHSRPKAMHLNGPRPVLTQEAAAPLLQEILMEAWSRGRTTPRAAALLFGMAPAVVRTITDLSSCELTQVVADHAQHLRPRWDDSRLFWTRLIQAVIGTDQEALIDVQLHCLSLLGGNNASVYA
jgi:hypothetical protein